MSPGCKRSAPGSVESFESEVISTSPVISEESGEKKPIVRYRTTFNQKQVAILEKGEAKIIRAEKF